MPELEVPMSSFAEIPVTDDNDYIIMLVDGMNAKVKKSDFLSAIDTAIESKYGKTGGVISGPVIMMERQSVQAGFFGSCEDLFPGYSAFYVSGNLQYDKPSMLWVLKTNDTINGGSVIVFCTAAVTSGVSPAVAGKMIFQIDVPSGFNSEGNGEVAQTLTNAEMRALAKPLGM